MHKNKNKERNLQQLFKTRADETKRGDTKRD